MSEEIVGFDDVLAAGLAVQGHGQKAMEQLALREPYLVGFIEGSVKQMAGILALDGAPPPIVRKLAKEIFELSATIMEAMQRGSYRMWVGLVPADSPLARETLLVDSPPESDKKSH